MQRKSCKINKIIIAGVMAGTVTMFAGCGNVIPEMSDVQRQKVGEYAAMSLLRYDANYRSRLVELPEEPPMEEPAPEEEPVYEEPEPEVEITVTDNSSDVSVVDATEDSAVSSSPEEFLALPDGVSLIYQGYSVQNTYPAAEESYFSLDASDGKKLVVLHYTLYNQSGADQYIDFFNSGDVFKLKVNGGNTRTALMTMLLDDMSTFAGTVANGYGEELVLIFEEDEGLEISSLELRIKNTDGECIVKIE